MVDIATSSADSQTMGNTVSRTVHSAAPWLATVAIAIQSQRNATSGAPTPTILQSICDAVGSGSFTSNLAGNLVGLYLLFRAYTALKYLRYLNHVSFLELKNDIGGRAFGLVKRLPQVQGRLRSEKGKLREDLRHSLKGKDLGPVYTALPEEGWDAQKVVSAIDRFVEGEKEKWDSGRVSGAVYHGGEKHLQLLNSVYERLSVTNPLHPDIWPSVMKMEAEVVAMTASLLNGGDQDVCGLITSGGTESIFMSVKAHRDWGREKGITNPEVVVPRTAHPAFDKACDVLGMKLVKVSVDEPSYKVNLAAVRRNVNRDTVLIVGSAPHFPHGIIDPIEELAAIARSADVGLHVDCCLGGFVLPFARKLGYDIPAFDFGVDGVTAMSCDTHKFGYAAKGTSVCLFRNPAVRRHAYFAYVNWPGGLYVTPTLQGSRAGGLSGACWASMMHLGMKGFLDATRKIMETCRAITAGLREMHGVEVLGDPKAMVVAFKCTTVSTYAVSDRMAKRGWSLNAMQMPASIHICCTLRHVDREEELLSDVREVVAELEGEGAEADEGATAPIYGMASALPAGPIQEMLATYVDVVSTAE